MQRVTWVMLVCVLLVACADVSPSAPNTQATATREGELREVANVREVATATVRAAETANATALATSQSAPRPSISPTSTAPPTLTPGARVAAVMADGLANLRAEPSIGAALVTQIMPGTNVTIMETDVASPDGGPVWVRVSHNGQIGFLRSDLLGAPHVAPPPTPTPLAAVQPTATPLPQPTTTTVPTLAPTRTAASPSATPTSRSGVMAKGTLTPSELTQRQEYTRVEIAELSRNTRQYGTGARVRIEGTIVGVENKLDAKVQAVLLALRSVDGAYATAAIPGVVSQYPLRTRVAVYGVVFSMGSVGLPSGGSVPAPYILAEIVDIIG